MEDFYIDKQGNDGIIEENETVVFNFSEDEDADDFLERKKLDLLDELPDIYTDKKSQSRKIKEKFNLEDTYLVTSYTKGNNDRDVLCSNVDQLLKKSALPPELERQNVASSIKTKHALKIERKRLKEKTKGKKWFDIPATEVTKEIRNDFQLLKMRSVLDSKHVYKKNIMTKIPKYFQVGTVIESPADFYSGRIPKSQRKKTIVDELLADAEFRAYQKKKYKEIMDNNRRRHSIKKTSKNKKLKKKESSKKNKNK